MITPYIKSLGVEVECGYANNEAPRIKKFIDEKKWKSKFSEAGDGSVNVPPPKSFKDVANCDSDDGTFGVLRRQRQPSGWYRGAEFRFWSDKKKDLHDFMKFVYNEAKIRTNRTCGLHMHITANPNIMAMMTYQQFYKNFMKEYTSHYKTNKKYMQRLTNNYCEAKFSKQRALGMLLDDNYRYSAINLSSIRKHGTIEFRIMPHQQNYKEFKRTFEWFCKTLDKTIRKVKKSNFAGERIKKSDLSQTKVKNVNLKYEKVLPEVKVVIDEFVGKCRV